MLGGLMRTREGHDKAHSGLVGWADEDGRSSGGASSRSGEPGVGEAADEVESLLWDAQLAFVNHEIGIALKGFHLAARRGSAAACLNLASLYLSESDWISPSPLSASAPFAGSLSPSTSPGSTPTRSANELYSARSVSSHSICSAAQWLIRGLDYCANALGCPAPESGSVQRPFLDTIPTCGPTASAPDLQLIVDLARRLASLYCHGKLSPNTQRPADEDGSGGSGASKSLWEHGACAAGRLLAHPLFATLLPPEPRPGQSFFPASPPSSLASLSTDNSDSPNAPLLSLEPDTKLKRTIIVILAYILALARLPPSLPTSPRFPFRRLSACTDAIRLCRTILKVSHLPGGTGTRLGEHYVAKAARQLVLLNASTPSRLPLSPLCPRPRSMASSCAPETPTGLAPFVTVVPAEPVLSRPNLPRSASTGPVPGLSAPSPTLRRRLTSLASLAGPQTLHVPPRLHALPALGHRRSMSSEPQIVRVGSGTSLVSLPVTGTAEAMLQRALEEDEEAREWAQEEEAEDEEAGAGLGAGEEERDEVQAEVERADCRVTRFKSDSGMDPVLADLEAKSRLNVQTECAVCKKKGLNFPKCPKCELEFCCRSCRVSVGDGERHRCFF